MYLSSIFIRVKPQSINIAQDVVLSNKMSSSSPHRIHSTCMSIVAHFVFFLVLRSLHTLLPYLNCMLPTPFPPNHTLHPLHIHSLLSNVTHCVTSSEDFWTQDRLGLAMNYINCCLYLSFILVYSMCL